MWNILWGYSKAQVDLMLSDAPHVDYKNKGDKTKFKKPTRSYLKEIERNWKEKHPDGNSKVDLTEFLKYK